MGIKSALIGIAALLLSAYGLHAQTAATAPAAAATGATPAATTTAPATAPAAALDLCKYFVDLYDPIELRIRFIAASGVDNELDEKKFVANQGKPRSFIQPYDRWEEMLKFDKNGNKTIDWTEAEAYRQSVRQKVLDRFDTEKKGRLEGKDREAANLALASGEIFDDSASPASRRARWVAAMLNNPDVVKHFNKSGTGTLSDEERQEALRVLQQEAQQKMATGQGSGAGRGRQGSGTQSAFKDWMTAQFDTEGKGYLDDSQKAAMDKFEKQLAGLGKSMELALFDLDGDGVISPEERKQVGAQWMKMIPAMMAMNVQYKDADGDGKVSPEENQAFEDRIHDAMTGWLQKQTTKYAADGTRLTEDERTEFVNALKDDMHDRLKHYSADGSGHVTPQEMINLFKDFGEEIGIKPLNAAAPEASAPGSSDANK